MFILVFVTVEDFEFDMMAVSVPEDIDAAHFCVLDV